MAVVLPPARILGGVGAGAAAPKAAGGNTQGHWAEINQGPLVPWPGAGNAYVILVFEGSPTGANAPAIGLFIGQDAYANSPVLAANDIVFAIPAQGRPNNVDYWLIPQTSAGGSIPGKIASGSGDIYLVYLYPNGKNQPASPAGAVPATQLQVDAAEVLPANTWTAISKGKDASGNTIYTMQAPVYL